METKDKNTTRFDARLPKAQKDFFERAALLGGYRNLTDFIILTVQEKAKEIITERDRIIASERDSLIFFKAITEGSKPNAALSNAVKEYDQYIINQNKRNDNTTRPKKGQKEI